jgi:hypothetical protein
MSEACWDDRGSGEGVGNRVDLSNGTRTTLRDMELEE